MKREDRKLLKELDLWQSAFDRMKEEERLHPPKIPKSRYKPKIPPQFRTVMDVILSMRGYRDYASLYETIPALQFLLDNGWAIRPCESCKRGAFSHESYKVILCSTCLNLEDELIRKKWEKKLIRKTKKVTKLVTQNLDDYIVPEKEKVSSAYTIPPVTAEEVSNDEIE